MPQVIERLHLNGFGSFHQHELELGMFEVFLGDPQAEILLKGIEGNYGTANKTDGGITSWPRQSCRCSQFVDWAAHGGRADCDDRLLSSSTYNARDVYLAMERKTQNAVVADFTRFCPDYDDVSCGTQVLMIRDSGAGGWTDAYCHVAAYRALTLAILLHQESMPRMMLLVDPTLHLGPSAARMVISALRMLAIDPRRGEEPVQVVMSTTDVAAVDALEAKEINVLQRDPESGMRSIRRVEKRRDSPLATDYVSGSFRFR